MAGCLARPEGLCVIRYSSSCSVVSIDLGGFGFSDWDEWWLKRCGIHELLRRSVAPGAFEGVFVRRRRRRKSEQGRQEDVLIRLSKSGQFGKKFGSDVEDDSIIGPCRQGVFAVADPC